MFFVFLQSQLCKIRSKIRVNYRVKLVRGTCKLPPFSVIIVFAVRQDSL